MESQSEDKTRSCLGPVSRLAVATNCAEDILRSRAPKDVSVEDYKDLLLECEELGALASEAVTTDDLQSAVIASGDAVGITGGASEGTADKSYSDDSDSENTSDKDSNKVVLVEDK